MQFFNNKHCLKTLHFFLLATLILFSSQLLSYDIFYDYGLSSKLSEAIEYSYREEFEIADSILVSLYEESGDSIAVDFFRATIKYSKMKDSENFNDSVKLVAWIESMEEKLSNKENLLTSDYFIKGMLSFYKALILVDTGGSMISAALNLRSAASLLEQASIDSTLRADAYLGLGTYKFFKSSKAGFLRNILIVSDERDEGIEMLRNSSKHSRYGRWPAMHALALSYSDIGDFVKADSLVQVMQKLNPKGKTALWDAIFIAKQQSRYEAIDSLGLELLELLGEDGNGFNQIEVLYELFHAQLELDDVERAKFYAEKAVSWNIAKSTQERQKHKISKMREFLGLN